MVEQSHPGCYGLPIAVSANSPSCQICPFLSGCLYAASRLLESLIDNPLTKRERQVFALTRTALAGMPLTAGTMLGQNRVAASSRGRRTIALTPDQLAAFGSFPERIRSPLTKLSQEGWFDFARGELRAGRNPASKGWKKVFCDLLLRGGASRATLELALVERLCLKPAAARVQASVGMAVFAAGKIATERSGRFALLPNAAY